ncbi:uncharacterized protein EKO05_0010495 [Ascochyta rabiei]|uniref:uncharacterized protein n=1 Tax=Didymella rabiei TaxID=5454 RepID=UPI001900211D|nr:uncharacterized protein EKO05_0010495 [Ascochyta rabiei]UPX20256.1 hypothetical protein EKO05_0010495 [Ascochyta rabiei]
MVDTTRHLSERFEYTALANPAQNIRLIEVHQPSGPSLIPVITISETTIRDAPPASHAPPYDAISYTWGDAIAEDCIYIRHCDALDMQKFETLIVRRNCADVLRQLAQFASSRYYWIDAICINQEDEDERAQQVALMGNVFGRAQCVLACVGAHRDDSAFLAHTLDRFDEFMAAGQVSSSVWTMRTNRSGNTPWRSRSDFGTSQEARCVIRYFAWVRQASDLAFERFFRALDRFARRVYFWRIWILQELCLANKIRIFCGDNELRLSSLLFWWRDAKSMAMHQIQYQDADSGYPVHAFHTILEKLGPSYLQEALWKDPHYFQEHGGSGLGTAFEDMLYERQATRSGSQPFNRHLMAIPDVLRMCEYRQCQDPRDCIYGTLALCNWRTGVSLCRGGHHVNNGSIIQPDYKMSAFDLAKSLMPGLHDVPQLNRLVMGMLGLSHLDPEVQKGLELRCRRFPDLMSLETMPYRRISNGTQSCVHIVEGGFQLTPDSPWSLLQEKVGLMAYTKVLGPDDRCCAITSVSVKTGDWLIPTHYGRGFVLRQWGHRYTIIAKAYCPPELMSDELVLTAFMMWYDVDDLLIHLVGGLRGLAADEIDPPSRELIEHLNIGFCATENSSFGQMPSRRRILMAYEYDFDTLGVCETIVRDCYEDNDMI